MDGIKPIGEVVSAWEDINAPMALAPRPAQPATCSALQPATKEQFAVELTSCLALVAPVGMAEEARREWLTVAWDTLQHLPADLLHRGCVEARRTCDHPAKLVPAILAATAEGMQWKKLAAKPSPLALAGPSKRSVMDRRGEPMSQADTDKLNSVLEGLGATARYRPDGSRYSTEDAA